MLQSGESEAVRLDQGIEPFFGSKEGLRPGFRRAAGHQLHSRLHPVGRRTG